MMKLCWVGSGVTLCSGTLLRHFAAAFRLVAIAYGFVWVVLIGYVWSVSRRLQSVERELAKLEQRST